MPITRRRFIKTTSVAAASAWALPAISYARVPQANNRLALAVVGCGGMGHAHLRQLMGRIDEDNVAVTRVCDVYRRRLDSAIEHVKGDDKTGTMEYQAVIDDRDVDALIIATPDHWHTKIAIEAMDAGKDVFVEKPLSHTIEQALECRDAVRRTGRVLQVGPQATSDDRFWKAQRAIAANRIGKVTWSQGSYCRNSRGGQFNWHIDPDATPHQPKDKAGYVWWDRWLGHEWDLAPRIDWNPDHFFRFRKYFAYNGGVATDLLYHKLAPLLLAISGPDGEYPQRVVASGGRYLEKDERDIPDTFMMTVEYPSEHAIVLVSVMTNDVGVEDIIRGQYGTMYFSGNFDTGTTGQAIRIEEQSPWHQEFRDINAGLFPNGMTTDEDGRETPDPKPGDASFELHTSPRRDHQGAWIDAIRGDGEVTCNVDLGCSTMVAIKMGVEAYRQDKVMRWDANTEQVV